MFALFRFFAIVAVLLTVLCMTRGRCLAQVPPVAPASPPPRPHTEQNDYELFLEGSKQDRRGNPIDFPESIHHVANYDEFFSAERKKVERNRDMLLVLIRLIFPTAQVDVIAGLQMTRLADETTDVDGVQRGPKKTTVKMRRTIILAGKASNVNEIDLIGSLARAIFDDQRRKGMAVVNNLCVAPCSNRKR